MMAAKAVLLWLGLAIPVAFAQETAGGEEAGVPADATAAHAYFDLRREVVMPGDVEAGRGKAELCASCHGADGAASIAPMFPNLAGQRASYLYWELREYKRGTLPESPMTPLAADLSDDDMRDLASFYASLRPQPVADELGATAADPQVLARGERLYLHGDPAKGIPPCQGCHGQDGRGHPLADEVRASGHRPFAAYPALRGQRDVYLQSRLAAFRDGKMRYSTTDFVMTGIGKRLDEESINALSAWLSSLPP